MIYKAIATHVITGFLGVGKTSFIQYLLAHKPDNEVWAVLVNEFGEIGIDASLLKTQDGSVAIKEVAGGCICCAAGVPTQVAVNQLIAKAKPDRLFIEPTGLGHPKAILDALTQPHFQAVIDLKATICLVDARNISDSRYRENDIFNQQLEIADLILATKKDAYQADELSQLQDYLNRRAITAEVKAISLIDTHLLDNNMESEASLYQWLKNHYWLQAAQAYQIKANPARLLAQGIEQDSHSLFSEQQSASVIEFDANGVCHKHNQHEGVYSAGWVFDCFYEFDFDGVMLWLNSLSSLRLKAVLICNEGIVAINRIDEQLKLTELDDAMDSRIEIISEQPIPREAIELQLFQLGTRLV